jgi:hypothetical protein
MRPIARYHLKKLLPFADKAKLWELAEHGGCDMTWRFARGSNRGGRGGLWLNLTEEQYLEIEKVAPLVKASRMARAMNGNIQPQYFDSLR